VPAMTATIDRRILVTFTVDPDAARAVLPAPFRPDLSFGPALAGLCLIKVSGLRPAGWPARTGRTVQKVVHRVAVEWDAPDGVATGVYSLRRDTDSGLAAAAGGRVFPGRMHRAVFGIAQDARRVSLAAQSRDGAMSAAFVGEDAAALPGTSVFTGPDSASAFFRCDRVAYSANRRRGGFDGLRMDTERWEGTPMHCEYVQSSVFEDRALFPAGSVAFDHALVVRDLPARWVPLGRLEATPDPRRGRTPVDALGRC
jgi:hypothetical protein